MKKQNVNNKLAFNKAAVTELNDAMLVDVNGGATPLVISWA
ncbi:class I lanthipeptide, partial [Flavobacterium amniphilum]